MGKALMKTRSASEFQLEQRPYFGQRQIRETFEVKAGKIYVMVRNLERTRSVIFVREVEDRGFYYSQLLWGEILDRVDLAFFGDFSVMSFDGKWNGVNYLCRLTRREIRALKKPLI